MTNAKRLALFRDLFDQRAAAGVAKLAKADFPSLAEAIDNVLALGIGQEGNDLDTAGDDLDLLVSLPDAASAPDPQVLLRGSRSWAYLGRCGPRQ